jgi:formylglycine-generating enzyme required for sulfatase activity
MGSDKSKDTLAANDELPQHSAALPAYFIGRYEVTVGQYKACVSDGGCKPGDQNAVGGNDDLPVRYVSWHEALAYCRWLEAKLKSSPTTPKALADALGGRLGGATWRVTLPSEAEWEKAARGADGRIYPWGASIDPTNANYDGAKKGGPTPVGSYPAGASPYGLLDMSGNVWEWTRSHYKDYPYRSSDGREDLSAGNDIPRVVRGGSFYDSDGDVRAAYRDVRGPVGRLSNLGFRVVVSPFSPGTTGAKS